MQTTKANNNWEKPPLMSPKAKQIKPFYDGVNTETGSGIKRDNNWAIR